MKLGLTVFAVLCVVGCRSTPQMEAGSWDEPQELAMARQVDNDIVEGCAAVRCEYVRPVNAGVMSTSDSGDISIDGAQAGGACCPTDFGIVVVNDDVMCLSDEIAYAAIDMIGDDPHVVELSNCHFMFMRGRRY